jgi:hypothetical protein
VGSVRAESQVNGFGIGREVVRADLDALAVIATTSPTALERY